MLFCYCIQCQCEVHARCYGVLNPMEEVQDDPSFYLITCPKCKYQLEQYECMLCHQIIKKDEYGFMIPVEKDKWAHTICVLMSAYFEIVNPLTMQFKQIKEFPKSLKKTCNFCLANKGELHKCNSCETSSHSSCIFENNAELMKESPSEPSSERWSLFYELTQFSLSFVPKHIKQYWDCHESRKSIEITVSKERKSKKDTSFDQKGGYTEILCKAHKTDVDDYMCFCGKNDPLIPMVVCEYCEIWYHFACVGFSSSDSKRKDVYICEKCTKWIAHTKNIVESELEPLLDTIPSITGMKYRLVQVLFLLCYWYKKHQVQIEKGITVIEMKKLLLELGCLPIRLTSQIESIIGKYEKAFQKDTEIREKLKLDLNYEEIEKDLKLYEVEIKMVTMGYLELKKEWGLHAIKKLTTMYNSSDSKEKIDELVKSIKDSDPSQSNDAIKSFEWVARCSSSLGKLFPINDLMSSLSIENYDPYIIHYKAIKAHIKEATFTLSGIASTLYQNMLGVVWKKKSTTLPYTPKRLEWLINQATKCKIAQITNIESEYTNYIKWVEEHNHLKSLNVSVLRKVDVLDNLECASKLMTMNIDLINESKDWLTWIVFNDKLKDLLIAKVTIEKAQALINEGKDIHFPENSSEFRSLLDSCTKYESIILAYNEFTQSKRKFSQNEVLEIISMCKVLPIECNDIVQMLENALSELSKFKEEILKGGNLKEMKAKIKGFHIQDDDLMQNIKAQKWMVKYDQGVKSKPLVAHETINELFYYCDKLGAKIDEGLRNEIIGLKSKLDTFFDVIKTISSKSERVSIAKVID